MLSQDACLGLSRWGTTVSARKYLEMLLGRDFHDPSCAISTSSRRGAAKTQQHRERERERERQGEEEAMDREDIVRGEPTTERGNQEGNHTTLLVADEIGQVKGE